MVAQGKGAKRLPPWVATPQIFSPSPPAAGGEGRGEEGFHAGGSWGG